MSDLMQISGNLKRNVSMPSAAEPTKPGPVSDDDQRIWDDYDKAGYGAIDPSTFNDTNSWFVDGVNGLDTNPGTELLPFKTISKATDSFVLGKINAVIMNGTYRERIVIGSKDINSSLPIVGNLYAYSGATPTIACPDEYPTPKEDQANWDNLNLPVTQTDDKWEVEWGVGFKYYFNRDNSGRMRCLLPNRRTSRDDGRLAYQWYIDDGHYLQRFNFAMPIDFMLKEVQRIYQIEGLLVPFRNGRVNPEMSYNRVSGVLSDARIQSIKQVIDNTGSFGNWTTNFIQPNGTTGVTVHHLGTAWSGWVVSLLDYRLDKTYIAVASITVDGSNEPLYSSQRISIFSVPKVLATDTYELVDEWVADTGTLFAFGNVGNVRYIGCQWNHVGLLTAGDKIYFCQPKLKSFYPNFPTIVPLHKVPTADGDGSLRVSNNGSTFQQFTIAGIKRMDAVAYYRDRYWATAQGKLYRSDDGITNWIMVHSDSNLWLNQLNEVNNILFISGFTYDDTKVITYTQDGILFNTLQVPLVANRLSMPSGFVFKANGRACVMNCRQPHNRSVSQASQQAIPQDGGGGGSLRAYPMANFQESLINYETTHAAPNKLKIENLNIDGLKSTNVKGCGSLITEGRGWGI